MLVQSQIKQYLLIKVLYPKFDWNDFKITKLQVQLMPRLPWSWFQSLSICHPPNYKHFLPRRQQWLVPISQGQTAMAADRPGQEVSTDGHRHPGDLQLIWLGLQVHLALWRPTGLLDAVHNERRKLCRCQWSRMGWSGMRVIKGIWQRLTSQM